MPRACVSDSHSQQPREEVTQSGQEPREKVSQSGAGLKLLLRHQRNSWFEKTIIKSSKCL